jgi:Prion-inhibition and propagation
MVEAAGLAIGIISLATTFDSIINIFEYIHLGKTFGPDFQDCLLKLDNARLRLSRWGEAVGLSQVDENTKSLKDTKISEADIPRAERLLGAILEELERVKVLDAKFRAGKECNDQSLVVLSAETDLNSIGMSLHETMRKMAKQRQNHLSLRQKAKWALFDRAYFKDMIEKVGDNTKELLELFPAAQPLEKALVDKETLELSKSLQVLKDVINEQDKTLASALNAILKPVVSFVRYTYL